MREGVGALGVEADWGLVGSGGERGVQAGWVLVGSGEFWWAFRRTGVLWVLVSSGGERFPH